MGEVNLLSSLPNNKRDILSRKTSKTKDHVRISSEYGKEYFDGDRDFGYGGYYYDGRWKPVARDIIDHFNLKTGDRVLDVGCAKGFLIKDLVDLEINAFGLDISSYALANCIISSKGRLCLGSAEQMPFPDNSFDVVLSINTLHNLTKPACVRAISEIERISRGSSFIQVDSYLNKRQKDVFESWVLTAKTYGYPDDWVKIFNEANYTGDYFWTIMYEKI